MGMIELIKVASAAVKKWHSASGPSVTVIGEGIGGQTVEAEVYNPAGVYSRPPKGSRGLFISLGRGRRYGVVIGGHNYQLDISLDDGETVIYSTDATGATLKASIALRADGTIEINGTSKYLVTYGALNLALSGFLSALNIALGTKLDGGGTPGALTLDISGCKASTLRTDG